LTACDTMRVQIRCATTDTLPVSLVATCVLEKQYSNFHTGD